MKPRERMVAALTHQPVDRPPHFEHMFELEEEAFGVRFPPRESWAELTGPARTDAIRGCVDIYERIVEAFEWDALTVFWPWIDAEAVRLARERFDGRVLVGTLLGDALWCIDTIEDWEGFAIDLFEDPASIHARAEAMCSKALTRIDELADAGCEQVSLVHDVADNRGPFCRPEQFDEIVTPYLARLVERVKQRGMFCTVHSDGNLMPVLESILSTEPTTLHSLDPMAGMDIATIREQTRGRVALMGNVRCDALEQGPLEEIEASARACLEACGRETGYVFSSSNTIFPGMPLANYRHMLRVYRDFCESL